MNEKLKNILEGFNPLHALYWDDPSVMKEDTDEPEEATDDVGTMEEDTVKVDGGYENIGDEGKHSKKPLTKKKADDQRKAMFAQGYKT